MSIMDKYREDGKTFIMGKSEAGTIPHNPRTPPAPRLRQNNARAIAPYTLAAHA